MIGLERHVMDMEFVEEHEWICRGLHHLRVRIRGLDTKVKIDGSLKQWTEGKGKECTVSNESTIQVKDSSIETRVAKHLLTFSNLKELWLGTRTAVKK